jgi:uncharacterized metal-binding protein
MPNYKTHDRIGLVATAALCIPLCAVEVSQQQQFPYNTLQVSIGILFGTYFLSPDLDTRSRIYYRWGILRFLWYPYQRCVKHRSWISHSGPISGTIRFFYLYCILVGMSFFVRGEGVPIPIPLYLGILLSDILHTITDKMSR